MNYQSYVTFKFTFRDTIFLKQLQQTAGIKIKLVPFCEKPDTIALMRYQLQRVVSVGLYSSGILHCNFLGFVFIILRIS